MDYIQNPEASVESKPSLTLQDVEHLNLLSITGYILGGLTVLFSCWGLFYVVLGFAFAFSKFPVDPKSPPPPTFMGWIFVAVGLVVVLIGWTIGGLTIYAGRCLAARKKKTLIQVMAAINCLHMPFGTLWGVFVFVVLSRPTVAAAFEQPNNHLL